MRNLVIAIVAGAALAVAAVLPRHALAQDSKAPDKYLPKFLFESPAPGIEKTPVTVPDITKDGLAPKQDAAPPASQDVPGKDTPLTPTPLLDPPHKDVKPVPLPNAVQQKDPLNPLFPQTFGPPAAPTQAAPKIAAPALVVPPLVSPPKTAPQLALPPKAGPANPAMPCLPGQPQPPGCGPTNPYAQFNGKLLVFVADGSGDAERTFDNLKEVVRQEKAPVLIKQIKWSRFGELLRDVTDQEAQLNIGFRLAALVTVIRKEAPTARFIFVGHSAGTRVMLAAAEALPPASVERIFLLSSTVSCTYDLRRALQASRFGIDNYYSPYDAILEMMEERQGTSDGKRMPCAGRIGFRPPLPANHPAMASYCNLRQVKPSEERDGVNAVGGHYTWTRASFLRNQLLPQIFYPPLPPQMTHTPK